MKNQKEMMLALLAGERLVGIDERSVNEYWLDKQDGRIYYRNTKEDTFPCKCNGIPTFDKLQVKPKTININGIEVPEPVRELEERSLCYWAPNFGGPAENPVVNFFVAPGWDSSYQIRKYQAMGFVHSTKEAALLHREALLSFTQPKP